MGAEVGEKLSISVILPAYKEAQNLEQLLPNLNAALAETVSQYEILVVDTMEPVDNTKAICLKNNCAYINRIGGNNYGDAIRTGIGAAVSDWLVIMDADGSHDPQDIRRFYNEMQNGYDIVIGSRYTKGGNSHNGFILKAMSFIVNFTYRLLFNIKAKDVSDSYRMYNGARLKKLKLSCNNFDIVEEILILFSVKYKDFRLKEVPIYFNKRLYGESKRNLVKFVFSYIGSIIRMYRIKLKAKHG